MGLEDMPAPEIADTLIFALGISESSLMKIFESCLLDSDPCHVGALVEAAQAAEGGEHVHDLIVGCYSLLDLLYGPGRLIQVVSLWKLHFNRDGALIELGKELEADTGREKHTEYEDEKHGSDQRQGANFTSEDAAQHPSVSLFPGVEHGFEPPSQGMLLPVPFRKDEGGEHGRHGKGDEQGEQGGEGDGQCELPEYLADDARHHGDGNEHDNVGQGRGDDSGGDLRGPAIGRHEACVSHLPVPEDVLQHDH
jgi:hypothetical protein